MNKRTNFEGGKSYYSLSIDERKAIMDIRKKCFELVAVVGGEKDKGKRRFIFSLISTMVAEFIN
jgi:hypothetical protein